MYYAIISEDVEDSLGKRKLARPAHLKRLNKMLLQKRVLLAGPHPAIDSDDPGEAGFTGSLIVAEFDSLEQARAWANDDPYVAAGVYRNVIVKPFKKVLP
ncbi:MAG: YciI family protein [Pseudohongiellaceae bacterium]